MFTISSSLCCNVLLIGAVALEPVCTVTPFKYVYVFARVNKSSCSVIIFVLPTAGEPSATLPLPIYNARLSTAQPNSPPANCGIPFVPLPRLTWILEICTTAIICSLFYIFIHVCRNTDTLYPTIFVPKHQNRLATSQTVDIVSLLNT